jgi:hypothetical protein
MPKEGVEPSPCCQDGILNPARLPVPPLRLFGAYYCRPENLCQTKILPRNVTLNQGVKNDLTRRTILAIWSIVFEMILRVMFMV